MNHNGFMLQLMAEGFGQDDFEQPAPHPIRAGEVDEWIKQIQALLEDYQRLAQLLRDGGGIGESGVGRDGQDAEP